jgi:chromosomal replication initiator protein
MRAPATPELAARSMEALGGTLSAPALVIEAVAAGFGLTPADLAGRKRDKGTALARQVAMHLMRQETGCSLAQIGIELGGRDHSTVLHACEKIATELDANPALGRRVAEIQQSIHSRVSPAKP